MSEPKRPASWHLDLERASRGVLACDTPVVFARMRHSSTGPVRLSVHRRPFWRTVEATARLFRLSGMAGRSHGAIGRAVEAWRDRGVPEFEAAIIVRAALLVRVEK